MIKKIASVVWEMAEYYQIQLPYGHVIFGLMIGCRWRKK